MGVYLPPYLRLEVEFGDQRVGGNQYRIAPQPQLGWKQQGCAAAGERQESPSTHGNQASKEILQLVRYGLQADLAIDEHPDLASGRLKNLAFQVGALGNRLGGFLDGAFRRACRCRPVAPVPLESKVPG